MNAVPVITGIGLVTPLGRSVAETWASILAGQSIRTHARVETDAGSNTPRVARLALHAAHEAVEQSGWRTRPIAPWRTAIIVGTSKGPIESWIAPPLAAASPSDKPVNPAMASPVFGLASVAEALASQFEMPEAPRLTLSAACASGLHALIRGAMMIQSGEVTRVLVVAAEASAHPLFLGSFRRLGVLPPEGVPCRPFDQNRQGFLMSDAAAAVCLEAVTSDADPTASPIAAIERFAMAGDAKHITAGDPTGAVMRHLLRAVLGNRPVDLIHAHGTGTALNDEIELSAIEHVLACDRPTTNSTSDNPCYVKFNPGGRAGGSQVAVYSHKGAMGHSLGASGLVSVVLNCVAHRTGIVPPNVNTMEPIATRWTSISRSAVHRPVRRSLACATGFGGPTSVVSLISVK